MGSDPRIAAVMRVYEYDDIDVFAALLPKILAAADACDRDRGVVRVDTRGPDPEFVVSLTAALAETFHRFVTYDETRAVLAALTQEDSRGE